MENRRQTYRHPFQPQEALRAELNLPASPVGLACKLLDLSLGGMRVRLGETPASLRVGTPVTVRLLGRDDPPTSAELSLTLRSQVVYLARHGEEWHCGVHFLPIANPSANENIERILSRFLLGEQRRKRSG
jgi:c-di-GMP-binding flagellar brake protein YcgR